MRVPCTISKNLIRLYKSNSDLVENKSKIVCDDFELWDKNLPKSLKVLCVEAIANNWTDNPLVEELCLPIDRCLLLEILPTDLPLEMTIPKIENDIYWKRCFTKRWPKNLPVHTADLKINNVSQCADNDNSYTNSKLDSITSNHSGRKNSCTSSNSNGSCKTTSVLADNFKRKWKEYYLEMHVNDYFENLKPEEYKAEKIKEIADLCAAYVRSLNFNQLICSENSCNRIPLNSIVTGFVNLRELSICFKQTYVGEKFSWNVLRVSLQDIKLLAKGLEKCKLHKFRIHNSDIDSEKAIIVLKSLLKHENLKVLDFSYCSIKDRGAAAVSKFCLENNVESVILTNNSISSTGAKYLAYCLSQPSCYMKKLDLRLNCIANEGGDYLFKIITHGAKRLNFLKLNACNLNSNNTTLVGVIKYNICLKAIDLANNKLGEELGRAILGNLNANKTITKLDLRMCNIGSETEYKIQDIIERNRKIEDVTTKVSHTYSINEADVLELNQEFLDDLNNIFCF